MQCKPQTCPYYGHSTQRIHDYHIQKIKDIPAFGSYTVLLLRKKDIATNHLVSISMKALTFFLAIIG